MKTIKPNRLVLSFFLSFFLSLLTFTLDAQLYVNSSGNVGIGTSTPSAKLDLNLSGSGEGIQLNCSNYDVDIGLHNNTSYGYYWRYKGTGTQNDNDLELWTDGQGGADIQVYNVHQDGKLGFLNKVGFGTTEPLYGMIEIKKNGISDGICLNAGTYSSFRIAQVDDKV